MLLNSSAKCNEFQVKTLMVGKLRMNQKKKKKIKRRLFTCGLNYQYYVCLVIELVTTDGGG